MSAPKQPTLPVVLNEMQILKERITVLEKGLKKVNDVLNIQDNWHAETREWLGKEIEVKSRSGLSDVGILKWTDRYNICLVSSKGPRIWTKGGLDCLGPVKH